VSAPARFSFIDGLRGIAALAVVLPHARGLFAAPTNAASNAMAVCAEYGGRGVQLFFVISGFVIAYSLRDATRGSFSLKTFILRRAIRLDPPYWVAILVKWTVGALQSLVTHKEVWIPTAPNLLAHMFYLQDILGHGQMNAVFWTLCIEFQLYIVFAALLVVSNWLAPRERVDTLEMGTLGGFPNPPAMVRGEQSSPAPHAIRTAIVVVGFVVSLSLARTLPPSEWPGTWFIRFWYMFLAGVLLCWHMLGRVKLAPLVFCGASMIASFVWSPDSFKLSALLAAGVIYLALRRGKLSTWLSGPIWQFLGRLSYCIYLLHVPITMLGLAVRTRLSMTSAVLPFAMLACEYVAIIVASFLLHISVEVPCLRLAARFKNRFVLRPVVSAPAPE
jgi:peptidoglycan/LPS O-acetylase OafA/YrhL